MNRFVAAVLGLAGVVHLLPVAGVVGSATLTRLYGTHVTDANVELLLRHRALLFGVLGVGFLVAAARREWRGVGLGVAIVSTISFIALALVTPDRTVEVDRVVLVDTVLVALLAVATVVHARSGARR